MPDAITQPDPEADRQRLETIAALAMEHAKSIGASAAEVSMSVSEGLSVKARQRDVDTVEHNRDKSMGVTVYLGQATASASSADFSEEAVKETVAAACAIARHTSEDEFAGLANPEDMAKNPPDLDLYHPWDLEPDAAIDMAVRMESAARDFDPQISNTGGATVSRSQGVSYYANSAGFAGSIAGSRHSISCSAIAGEGTSMQRDHWYSASRLPESLESPEAVGEESARRALACLDSRPIPTGRYPVLFVPEMARTLLSHFVSAISGSALYRRSSFLLDKAGEKIFSSNVNIGELPLLPQALGSSPFDSDGLPRANRDLVIDGVLQGYVLSTYSARKLGLHSTANAGGTRNLTLQPGEYSEAQMLEALGDGVVVTEMMGQGVKLATGDYSRGAAGFRVENGIITHPVNEITVAGNLSEMFRDVVAVGKDLDERASIRSPSIVIGNMTIAGQ